LCYLEHVINLNGKVHRTLLKNDFIVGPILLEENVNYEGYRTFWEEPLLPVCKE
jgi:hypothetical protein